MTFHARRNASYKSSQSAFVEGDSDPVDNGDPQSGINPDVLSLAKVSPRV
ncbi:hypothetical protein HNP00_000896 [Arthrobacter sp. AZCC_0090]|nr:hypothetical protein [Arthrobacter sp. AZCC_0090]